MDQHFWEVASAAVRRGVSFEMPFGQARSMWFTIKDVLCKSLLYDLKVLQLLWFKDTWYKRYIDSSYHVIGAPSANKVESLDCS